MANRSLKTALGLRLTGDAISLLKAMSQRTGLSSAGIVELAVREKAARDGVSLEQIEDREDMEDARKILMNSDPAQRRTLDELRQAVRK